MQRLYRIRALRDLGVLLVDIGRMLEDEGAALGDVLRTHLARVDAEFQRLGRLRTILGRIRRIRAVMKATGESREAEKGC